MRAVISYQPRRGLGSRLTLPENTFSSFAHAFHLRQHSSNSSFAASSNPARLSVRRFSGREVGWRIEHVGRPRSGVHRVTCPTCAGEDGEQELPPMYDPREDLGR